MPEESPNLMQRIDQKTLITVGSAISMILTLSGAIWYGATKDAQLREIGSRVATIEARLFDASREIALVSNRQGVNESQYQSIKEDVQEIKEDIKSISQALRIKP